MEENFIKACYEATGKENTLKDAWSGDHYGFYSSLGAIDRTNDKGNRSYAASGYLRPNLGRQNLKVLTEALATRVILDTEHSQEPVATGVEFMLSAGVIQTPQLLELSGVGDPEVLKKAGVDCIAPNPAVGANFQDHVLGGMIFECAEGIRSLDSDANQVSQSQHLKDQLGERVQSRPDEDISKSEAREAVLRNYITTQYHLIGTAALGEVVGEKLRVKDVTHLRVIDASVFPAHVSGNIMASTYAVAEKGADLIKET